MKILSIFLLLLLSNNLFPCNSTLTLSLETDLKIEDCHNQNADNPILGFAFRWLAKTFIKKAVKQQVRKTGARGLSAYAMNQAANYAVDVAFDELNSNLSTQQKNHVVDTWYYGNEEAHFDECQMCYNLGNTFLQCALNKPQASNRNNYNSRRPPTQQYSPPMDPTLQMIHRYKIQSLQDEYNYHRLLGNKRKAKKAKKNLEEYIRGY
jgi:hypothetical protein